MNQSNEAIAASFRDPSGFLFQRDGVLYRQINQVYRPHYERLLDSGLYRTLTEKGWLIPHQEVSTEQPPLAEGYKVIRPEIIPFISYPYEWCFSQFKQAALLTLQIQRLALEHGLVLKDASAFNIQFRQGQPVLIDTLSFAIYGEGEPWVAYRQFCQHFLAPLLLMSYKDMRLNQLSRIYIDGVPLDLASELLPWRTRLHPFLNSHIHLHAKVQRRFQDRPDKSPRISGKRFSRFSLLALIDNLASLIGKLAWRPGATQWAEYYQNTNYSPGALASKRQVVGDFLERIRPGTVWDIGANTGMFSRLAAERAQLVVAFDNDAVAVERNYLDCRRDGVKSILPLVLDISNPSSGIGWENRERLSLAERGPADAIIALALLHHLAIANNVPLRKIAAFFRRLCRWLIIEFVPKNDSQVQRLLSSREDVFPGYTQEEFYREFASAFIMEQSAAIADSARTLFLLRSKAAGYAIRVKPQL